MDYNSFKTFLHNDLLKLFTSPQSRATFKTTSTLSVGSATLTLPAQTFVCVGDSVNIGGMESFTIIEYDNILSLVKLDHATVNEYAVDTNITIAYNYEDTLKNALQLAANENYALTQSLVQEGIMVRFDSETYILKSALVHVYTWILQNKASTKNLSLTGLQISGSDIFEHFYKLREAERSDIDDMRKEAYSEILDNSSKGTRGGGMRLNFMPVRRNNGRYR